MGILDNLEFSMRLMGEGFNHAIEPYKVACVKCLNIFDKDTEDPFICFECFE